MKHMPDKDVVKRRGRSTYQFGANDVRVRPFAHTGRTKKEEPDGMHCRVFGWGILGVAIYCANPVPGRSSTLERAGLDQAHA